MKKLPQQLVTFEIFDTPVWRWIALVTMGLALWILMGFLSWALVAVVRPLVKTPAFRGPLRLVLAVAGFRAAMEIASPSLLPRLYIKRALVLIFFLAVAWAGGIAVDLIAERRRSTRWRVRPRPVLPECWRPRRLSKTCSVESR